MIQPFSCPFCGCEKVVCTKDGGDSDKDGYAQSFWCVCTGCGARTAPTTYQPFSHHRTESSKYATPEDAQNEAIARWNRRV